MNHDLINTGSQAVSVSRRGPLLTNSMLTSRAARRVGALVPAAVVAAGSMASNAAHAAGQPAANGIGQQFQNMAQEAASAAGVGGSSAMYVCALLTFIGGAWAFWMSRQPQSRDGGYVMKGIAGLVLTGLFATGGIWIGKSAQTTGGAASTLTSDAGEVSFGG